MSLFRGRENEDVRLEIFRTAIGQSTSRASNVRNGEAFKDFLKADLPRVVKATVEGGHKGLLEELVGTLDIPPEVFRQHEGNEIRIQRSAKVFFLGCVTRLWAQGASHAT